MILKRTVWSAEKRVSPKVFLIHRTFYFIWQRGSKVDDGFKFLTADFKGGR